MDDIDGAHQVDPVHEVDHKDEHTGRFCVDIGRVDVDFGRFVLSSVFFRILIKRCASLLVVLSTRFNFAVPKLLL